MKSKSVKRTMNISKEVEIEVMRVHNLFWESYARRDIDLRFSLCSEDITFIGSGLHERATNKNEYKKINKEGVKQFPDPFQIEFLWTDLSMINENVACIESEVVWSQLINDKMSKELLRNTTLLNFDKNKWLVTHVHGSVPDYRLKDGEYMTNTQTIIRNKELERQVFERTRDLNKTLEELEQKNRELEIETALEKVRTVAMGMRKPDDMLDVCKTISLQLESLGVEEIRNVQTAIFYEQRGTYMNYEYYAKHDKTFITETVFTDSEIHNEFAAKMIKGKGEVFTIHVNGSEVKDWIAYQKTTNVFIDKYLETASSLNYYWFSLGPVALGISTYHPLTEEEIGLFKRFVKVFELAYRRYLDIEKAIAQAREAQIEASLERVRAVAMGMNKSDDLLSICEVSFSEFKKLGIDNIRNALIHIQYDNQKYFMDYDFSDLTGGAITKIEYGSHPVVEDYLKQIRSAKDAFYQGVIEEDQLEEWKEFRRNSGQINDPRLDKATALYYYFFSIGIGDIGISTLKSIDESQIKILKRFRNVFDLAYRRYNDIALAEAQAREAQIEASLDRVRASAMSMMKPDDLLNVCEVLFSEFHKLGFDVMRNAMINIHNDEKETFINYDYSNEIGRSINHLTYNIHPVIEKQIKQIRIANDAFSETSFTGKDLEEWKIFRQKIGEKDDLRINNISALYYYFYSIGTGSIGISTFTPIGEEKLTLLKRFRNVFSLSYQRYSDLALAEAQAREAQIELALERVRARAMAMQQTSELQEVVNEVAQQLLQMKIDMDGGVIIIINDEVDKDVPLWGSAGAANYVQKVTAPYLDIPIINRMISAIIKRESFLIERYTKEEKDEFMQHLFRHHPWNKLSQERKDELLSREGGYCRSMSISHHTSIAIINHHGRAFSEADNNILKRFGNVLEQSYTRFLDLKNAEAQAREAQIEAALERVRSRTMGMQKSEELKEVIQVVYEQFIHLKINVDHAGFVVDYTPKGDWHFWIADERDIPSKITHPYFESVWANQFNEAKEKGIDFFATNLNFEEKNYFYNELLSYVPGLPEASKDFYLSCPGLAATTVLFDNVSLYIENFSGTPYSDEDNKILMRFGKVFQQTYTRFLDLQKAEAQAREAKIEAALEKVRTVALSLKKSDEMLDIAQVLYEQLLELGFTNIRNSIIDIHNDNNETFMDYDYSHDMGRTVTLMSYYDDPIIEKQVRQIESSSDAFFEIILEGQDLQDLIDIRLKNGENEDPRLRQIEQLTYSLYSFGNGAIGISNFGLLSDEQKIVLKRFRNVFAFAYKRYTDMVRAETQAREAQIEASLERVRSRAMSMHSPNDLSETVNVFFKELKILGIIPIRCGVGQIDESTRTTSLTTTTSSQQGESFRVIGKVKQTGHPVLDGIFDHWKLQKEYHPVLEGEDIKAYYNVMNAQIGYPKYPEGVTQYGNNFFFTEGFVFAWTENLLSDEELTIFRRFTSVLSLTYRRYLDLKEAEERNKIIQAENDRKTKELEEARQLQLSLLPRTLPQLPQFDIAVYMKTATEVGGDYYDFNFQPNGVLNIGIGDATGHGLQAGTMITLMKGFFTADVAKFSPQKFLEHCNGIIRDIRLGRILMSFSHLRFENNSLLISSAGMPPVYYHHKKNNRTEEIIIQGLPLGALQSASYKLVEKQLNSGDTILLLTDGLPEQMNNHKVIFDYSRVLKYFDEIAEYDPNEIINRLVQKAEDWLDGQKQDDDVTFVVIKVK